MQNNIGESSERIQFAEFLMEEPIDRFAFKGASRNGYST